MGHGYLGPWVTFGSTGTTVALAPPTWAKPVVVVGRGGTVGGQNLLGVVDGVKAYQETIVEPGQTDRSNKQ